MRYFLDMGGAYFRLVGALLIVEFTKQSDHEVTIQDLKREGRRTGQDSEAAPFRRAVHSSCALEPFPRSP